MSKLRVAVIQGGSFSEREVSLKSGQAVINALDSKRYQVQVYDPAEEGLKKILRNAKKIDVALIIMHGRGGEDGCIQGFLDLLGIPYQSAGVLGCALAMDKPIAKNCFRLAGLPVAPDLVLYRGDFLSIERINELGFPVVVKPAREGSSCGINVVYKKDELTFALDAAFTLDNKILVERFLEGREITCGILGNQELQVLPLIEIIPDKKYIFFNYEAKYLPGASREICPAPLDRKTTAFLQEFAKRAHLALGLRGYSRSDFILTKDGPFILEINTIPGMTKTSLFPQAAQAAGLFFPALVDRLIDLALEGKE